MGREEELKNLLKFYDDNYYNDDNSLITDQEYDALKIEYLALTGQQEYSYVPGETKEQLGRYSHKYPIKSLGKVNKEEDLRAELKRLAPGIIEPKYDGLTIVFYPDPTTTGLPFQAASRGNGDVGEDITETCTQIEGVKDFKWQNILGPVRAEGFMKKSAFKMINKDRIRNGEEPFQNTRNAVAGMLRHKDVSKVKGVSLSFYDIVNNAMRETDKLNCLYRDGFPIPSPKDCFKFDVNNIEDAIEWMKNFDRDSLDYDIDGLVVKSNLPNSLEFFGSTGHHPKNAVAWKFPAVGKWTKLTNVIYQVGRTGRVCPVAEFDPIELLGSTVTRATLHNSAIMNTLGITNNCEVFVIKANDVIPAIIKVRNSTGHPYADPSHCPECGGFTEKINDQVFCTNPLCKAKLLANIVHFAKKDALDIDGLAEGTVQKMIDAGLVSVPTDLFKISESDIKALDGFAAKSAKKLYTDIQNARRDVPLNKFIYAAGIPNVGRRMSKSIAEEFGTFADLVVDIKANGPVLMSIDGIGKISASNIVKYKKLLGLLFVCAIPKDFVKPIPVPVKNNTKNNTKSYTFVLTGKMTRPRSEIEREIRALGHYVSDRVNNGVNYLACGDNVGATKTDAAKAKGVTVITEDEMWNIVRS